MDNDLCQAVVAQGLIVFLRGQCPQDLDTAQNIASHDPVEQTHKVMQNIGQLVRECGGAMEHVTKLVIYITDVRHREAVYRQNQRHRLVGSGRPGLRAGGGDHDYGQAEKS